MQNIAPSVDEQIEQQDPDTIHLTSWCSLKNKEKKNPKTYTLDYFIFLQHPNSALDHSLNLWGTWYSTLAPKTIKIHL